MRALLDLLFPQLCCGCSLPLNASHNRKNLSLCSECQRLWNGRIRCGDIARIPYLHQASYHSSVRNVVLRAKEENDSSAREVLAHAIARCILAAQLTGHFLLIAVPSARAANRSRGYIHGDLLAHRVGNLLDVEVVKGGLLHGRTVRDQTGLSASQRFENVTNSFQVSHKARNIGAPLVVIDDVVTTGSSMREAVRALKAADIGVLALISAVGTGDIRGADQPNFTIR